MSTKMQPDKLQGFYMEIALLFEFSLYKSIFLTFM